MAITKSLIGTFMGDPNSEFPNTPFISGLDPQEKISPISQRGKGLSIDEITGKTHNETSTPYNGNNSILRKRCKKNWNIRLRRERGILSPKKNFSFRFDCFSK